LELTHDERTHHALYHLLRSEVHHTAKLIEEKKRTNHGGNDEDDLDIRIDKVCRPLGNGNSTLLSAPSLPLPQRKDAEKDDMSDSAISEISFAFNADEWRQTDWTDAFYKKNDLQWDRMSTAIQNTVYLKKEPESADADFSAALRIALLVYVRVNMR
jgi:hypothetical protein